MNRKDRFIEKLIKILDLDQKVELFESFNNETFDSKMFREFLEGIIKENKNSIKQSEKSNEI